MKLSVKEMAVFSMLGCVMYTSKVLMDALPNIHLIGVFIVTITVVYRKKALYPIYIFVLLTGLFNGFGAWWAAYLYTWTVLWGMTMLIPKNVPQKLKPLVYMAVCGIHGFLYGILCAPAQALFFGLSFKGMLTWIAAGFSFDMIHGISNILCGVLIAPLIKVLRLADKATQTP